MTLFMSKPLSLLLALVILLFVSPFIESTSWGEAIITLSFSAILLAVVRIVWERRLLQVGTGLLASSVIVLLAIGEPFPQSNMWLVGEALYILLCVFIITYALIQIMTSEVVDRDVLVSAIAVYLLIGVTWSMLYSLVYGIDPNSFGDLLQPDQGYWNQLVYFSFSTLTTLGYGDIVALSPVTRMLAVFEAVVGVIFEAMIIARLVGLYRGEKAAP